MSSEAPGPTWRPKHRSQTETALKGLSAFFEGMRSAGGMAAWAGCPGCNWAEPAQRMAGRQPPVAGAARALRPPKERTSQRRAWFPKGPSVPCSPHEDEKPNRVAPQIRNQTERPLGSQSKENGPWDEKSTGVALSAVGGHGTRDRQGWVQHYRMCAHTHTHTPVHICALKNIHTYTRTSHTRQGVGDRMHGHHFSPSLCTGMWVGACTHVPIMHVQLHVSTCVCMCVRVFSARDPCSTPPPAQARGDCRTGSAQSGSLAWPSSVAAGAGLWAQ